MRARNILSAVCGDNDGRKDEEEWGSRSGGTGAEAREKTGLDELLRLESLPARLVACAVGDADADAARRDLGQAVRRRAPLCCAAKDFNGSKRRGTGKKRAIRVMSDD